MRRMKKARQYLLGIFAALLLSKCLFVAYLPVFLLSL